MHKIIQKAINFFLPSLSEEDIVKFMKLSTWNYSSFISFFVSPFQTIEGDRVEWINMIEKALNLYLSYSIWISFHFFFLSSFYFFLFIFFYIAEAINRKENVCTCRKHENGEGPLSEHFCRKRERKKGGFGRRIGQLGKLIEVTRCLEVIKLKGNQQKQYWQYSLQLC